MDASSTTMITIGGLVAGSFIATNMDNFLILVVLLGANSRKKSAVLLGFICSALLIIVSCYLAMAVLWAGLSYMISGQRDLARRVEHRAEKIVPWIMIGMGVYILMDTATDTLI